MNKYIFVNQVTGPLFIDILNLFEQKGCAVYLLTGEIEKASSELSSNIKVTKFIKYRRNNPVSRIFTWMLFTFFTFFKLLVSSGKLELFLVSNPPFAPFIGPIFKKLFNKKYHVLIYDVYPDALVKFNYISSQSILHKFWSKLNNLTFSQASNVFTISEVMADAIKSYYQDSKNLRIIDNWVDCDFIKPIKKESNWFAQKYNLVDKLTVLYSGNLGEMHDLESLIEAANILKENESIKFVIIGEGVKKAKLNNLITQYSLDNVLLLPFQAPEVIPYSMTSADIGVVTLSTGAQDVSVPSKTYYMMAAGNALLVISESDSELAKLCYKHKIGEVIKPNSPQKIADYLITCLDDKELLEDFSKNARKASKSYTAKNAELYYKNVS